MIVCKIQFLLLHLVVAFSSQHLLTCSVQKMALMCLPQNINMCLCVNLIKSHAWCHTSLNTFPDECLSYNKKMLSNLVPKMKFDNFSYIIEWLFMVILYWIHAYFHLIWNAPCSLSNSIIYLLKLVAEKSASTFSDVPDWFMRHNIKWVSLKGLNDKITFVDGYFPTWRCSQSVPILWISY